MASARATGKPVPIDMLTTPDSTTTANPDGTFTTTTTVAPTRMKDATGAWEDIDPTLRRAADGSITTVATPNTLRLSGGGSGPAISVADTAGHAMTLSLPENLPAPSLSGASATYSNVTPGIDLVVTAQPSGGFGEVFTVHDAAAAATAKTLSFATHLSGLKLRQDPAGNLNATDATTGQVVWTSPVAEMWDSATSTAPMSSRNSPGSVPTSGSMISSASGPGRAAHQAKLAISIVTNGLDISGDPAQLGATPTWPLYLDPSWTLPYQSGATQESANISEGSPCSEYPDWNPSRLNVGYNDYYDPSSSCVGAKRAYYQIDTSNVLQDNYIIKSAWLKVNETYSAFNSCNQGSEKISIYTTGAMTSPPVWGSAPAPGQLITYATVSSVGNQGGTQCSGGVLPVNFDVINGINQARSGNWPNWTFVMVGNETAGSHSMEGFASNAAVTTVYTIPPNTPSSLTATPAPVKTGGGVSQGCDGNINGWMAISNFSGHNAASLSANISSPIAGAQVYGQFELYDHTTNQELFQPLANSQVVTGSGPVSVTTPDLIDGHLYTWQVNANDGYYSSPPAHYCGFAVDMRQPLNPTISSSNFAVAGSNKAPATLTYSNNPGEFTITSHDQPTLSGSGSPSGIRGFNWNLDSPVPANGSHFTTAGSSGTNSASATISLIPGSWGVHTLYANAVDNAGNVSAQWQYTFYAPWNPATKVAAGDIDGDGIPDILATAPNGDLVEYPGDKDPANTPVTLSTPATNPIPNQKDLAWNDDLVTHRGSFSSQGVDDLWVYDTIRHGLFIDKNSGSNPFQNTGNVAQITKAQVAIDATGSSDTACQTTSTGSCTNYNKKDWSSVTQILAPGDLYAGDSTDNHAPGLLTVENGSLWYYQGQPGPNYLATAVQLGTSGWNNVTLIAPGIVNGKPTLWARDKTTGSLYQYTITFDADGWPVNLGSPASGTRIGAAGAYSTAAYPNLLSPGNANNTAYPALYGVKSDGTLFEFPGQSTSGGASPLAPSPVNLTTRGWASAAGTTLEDQFTLPDGPISQWKLNDGGGTTASDTGTPGGYPATLSGGATLTTDGFADFDGTSGQAATTGPVLNTTQSYTVSAWVKINDTSTFHHVMSEDGANGSGFYLLYDKTQGTWAFYTINADTTSPTSWPGATSSVPAIVGVWTQLTGVYNASTNTFNLYVNGQLAGTGSGPAQPWRATGPLRIGAGKAAGLIGSFFDGDIADAQAYQQALTSEQAEWLYQSSGFNVASGKRATVSSVTPGWPASSLTNGILRGSSVDHAWSSGKDASADATEWAQIDLGETHTLNEIDLYPRDESTDTVGYCFPSAFTIDVSTDGVNWTTVVTKTGYPKPADIAQTFPITPTSARYIKVTGTTLTPDQYGDYLMQLQQITAYGA